MPVTVTKDRVKEVSSAIRELSRSRVMIGIPASKTARQTGAINNAQLGYIHEFGSPDANIPARPFLIPGVQAAEQGITIPRLKAAGESALSGDAVAMRKQLNAVGLLVSERVKRVITDGIPPPLSPATIAARRHSRGTKSQRASEIKYADLISKGVSPADAQTAAGITALINTAQMLRSITYVIRKVR